MFLDGTPPHPSSSYPISIPPCSLPLHPAPSLSTLFTFQQFDSVLWQPTGAYLSYWVELEMHNKSQMYFFKSQHIQCN